MPRLALRENCTACGACINRCPKKCISFKTDKLDNLYPFVDEAICIGCKQCEKVCPQLVQNDGDFLQTPLKAYAGWSNDSSVRKTSASGGAASAFYAYALKMGFSCYGVIIDEKWNLKYTKIINGEDYIKVRNSKYSFSDTSNIFYEIKNELDNGQTVVWIGLPCQTAGLRKYLGQDQTGLIAVDLICHGVCSNEYLKQYISSIEERYHQKYSQCFFRDANFDTSNFAFTLYTNTSREPDYIEQVKDGLYSMGYHKGIIYRENCYHCKYAQLKRSGDITLADYWMIGQKIPFSYERNNVSLIFVNSSKGEQYLKSVVVAGLMTAVERPVEEAVEVQGQLKHPTIKSFEQYVFVKNYKKTGNFIMAISKATRFRRLCAKKHLSRIFYLVYKVDLKLRGIRK